MTSIPASQLVSVTPNVLTAGGSALDIIGMILDNTSRVPIGQVLSFPDAAAVEAYFGSGSAAANYADHYFPGFDNSNKKPAQILYTQYPTAPVAAYLRGGNAGLTVAQLQAIKPASVTGSIGGHATASIGATTTGTASGVNLTTSSTTGLISVGDVVTGTGAPAGTYIVSQTSGTPGGDGVYVTNQATTCSAASLTVSSTVLDVTAVASGSLQTGDVISGTSITASTAIVAQLTGSAGSTGTYRISGAVQEVASESVVSLSTVLKVTAESAGTLVAGMLLSGTGVASGSRVVSQISGTTGGIGLYNVSVASTTISETITAAYDFSVTVNGTPATSSSIDLSSATSPSGAATIIGSAISETVTYDSVSGAFVVTGPAAGAAQTIGYGSGGLATALLFTQALGAVTSQGANAASPAAFMTALIAQATNWATFTTDFDPDNGSGNANKLAFATWNGLQNNRYAYVCEDNDLSPTSIVPATASLGYLLKQSNTSGTILVWEPSEQYATPFVMGMFASIDFTETNGRITPAYKAQSGLAPGVTSGTIAANLGGNPQSTGDRGNGYSFYGTYSEDANSFTWFQRGFITGEFLWADTYIDQIWLNSQFRFALLSFLGSVKSVPYNAQGYAQIKAACQDVINRALNAGVVRAGIPLSASQAAQVNADAGLKIDGVISTSGYYLQVLPADPTVRVARGSPPMTFYYTDGESVQAINLTSVTIL